MKGGLAGQAARTGAWWGGWGAAVASGEGRALRELSPLILTSTQQAVLILTSYSGGHRDSGIRNPGCKCRARS